MARIRNGGGAASAWALVIFGFGFVICLLLAIVFYTRLGGLEQRAGEAEQRLREYVSANEENSPDVRPLLEGRETVVSQLMEQNRRLRQAISSNQELTADALDAQLTEANITPPLMREIERLNAELAAREQRIAQLQQSLQDVEARAQTAEQQMAQLKTQYDQSVQQLTAKLESTAGEFAAYRQQVEQMGSQLQQQVTQVRQEREQELTEAQNRNAELEQENQVLRQKLAEVQGADGAIQPPNVTDADGRVVSVVQDGSKVYLNRGRADNLVLGMTFEVFRSDELVKPDDYDQLRGKATVEIIDVGENASVARVVRRDRGAVISAGDQLVNVVYDPQATYKFMVFGDFDIDGTGEATVADRQRIESMITRWGGGLTEDLSYDVDFLVLGQEPALPEPLPRDTIDPQKIKAHVQAQQEYERYQSLIGQARSLSIPILNQNRFLALVGYYQR